MSEKNFKEVILKSGLPLEVSVARMLNTHKIHDAGEVEYERDGKLFSTDIGGFYTVALPKKGQLMVNLAIECKYKTPNHGWYFMCFSDKKDSLRNDARNELFDDLLDPIYSLGYKKDIGKGISDLRIKNFFQVPIAHKGVEVCNGNSFADSINEAMSQAVHASITIQYSILRDIVHESVYGVKNIDTAACLTIPIIVTNAKLFLMSKKHSLEEIESLDKAKVEGLFTERQGVALVNSSSYDKYEPYISSLRRKDPIEWEGYSKEIFQYLQENDDFFREEILYYINPGYVYILNYSYLDSFLKKMKKSIGTTCNNFRRRIS